MAKYKVSNTIAFDFDGVIHDNCYYGCNKILDSDSDFGKLIEGAFPFIKKVQDLGFNVVIMSARKKRAIKRWLKNRPETKKYDMKFKCLPFWVRRYYDNSVIGITNTKVIAKMYIDDRAICFNGKFTKDLLKTIDKFHPWHKKMM